jgi:uracil-DNA glycosylase family 4
MRKLPLFEKPLPVPLADGPLLAVDPGCRRCPLGGRGAKTCIPAEGVEGRVAGHGLVLVIGEAPTQEEVRQGRPMIGRAGTDLRRVVRKYWPGDVVLDSTIRCGVSKDAKHLELAQERCTAYLRHTFVESMPDRVIVNGPVVARQVLGRSVKPFDSRKNYTWVRHPSGRHIPVFVMMSVTQVALNRHLTRMLEEDYEWALTVDTSTLMPPLDHDPDAVFYLVESAADAREAAEVLRTKDWVAYDCETGGRQFSDYFRNVAVGIAPDDEDTCYVWTREGLADPGAVQVLRELMEDDVLGKVGANEKYDKLSLRAQFGIIAKGSVLDVQLTKHLELTGCDASLNYLSDMVGLGGYWESFKPHLEEAKLMVRRARERAKKSKGKQLALIEDDEVLAAAVAHPEEDVLTYAYALVSVPEIYRYNALDCITTRRAAHSRFGFPLLRNSRPARHIWRNVVSHTTNAIEQMEAWGIAMNLDAQEQFRRYIASQLEPVETRIKKYEVNPASPMQIANLLFDRLRLKNPQAKGKGNRSTDAKALKAMSEQHPIVQDLREYRRLGKLLSAYGNLSAFMRMDGRIHPSFRIDGTETGRLSCVDPALHTLPRDEDGDGHTEGQLVKSMFGAQREGYVLLALDQSQIELRAAAHLSGDSVMRQIFTSGQDFHMSAAKLIGPTMWGLQPDQVGKAQRSATKSFVFGLIYGMTDYGMAARMNCSVEEAARLRGAILGKFTGLSAWIDEMLQIGRRTGQIATPFMGEVGRVRDLHEIGWRDLADYSDANKKRMASKRTAENGTCNTPCQTLASDIVLHALCTRIVPWLQRDSSVDARLVMTVHDSVLFEVAEHQYKLVANTVRDMMTDYPFSVPLVVDTERGENWGHMEKVEPVELRAA